MNQDHQLGRRHVLKHAVVSHKCPSFGTTACNHYLTGEQGVRIFFARVGECTELQGATMKGITDGE
jgi:hypothetical protein